MFKASELVAFCESLVGMPYWYGTCVYNCTKSLRDRKAAQYPSHYPSSRNSRYDADISKKLVCMDCVGMIKGFFWTNGGMGVKEAIGTGKSISSKYGGNGCPDRSADGMLSWCKSKGAKNGKIADLPDVPGVLLFSSGHVGVYVGDGYAVEARGFNYGVVKTKVSSRKWVSWAFMPDSVLEYDTANGCVSPSEDKSQKDQDGADDHSAASSTESKKTYELGDRTITRGVEGEDVMELQKALVKLGYDLGAFGANRDGIDGDCGSKTIMAIKDFQTAHGLTADGKYDDKTHAAMMKAIGNTQSDDGNTEFKIRVTGNTVNVRKAPDTSEDNVVRIVRRNTELTSVGVDSQTGWYKLSDGNYISYKYTRRV